MKKGIAFYTTTDCTLLFWKKCCRQRAAKDCLMQNKITHGFLPWLTGKVQG